MLRCEIYEGSDRPVQYYIYYGQENCLYGQHPLVWTDDHHPYVTDDDWSRMKAGEEVTVSDGCFYGIMDDAEYYGCESEYGWEE